MGDEMQVDLEDAGKKEAEEKRGRCAAMKIYKAGSCHGNRNPWQRFANPTHKSMFQQET